MSKVKERAKRPHEGSSKRNFTENIDDAGPPKKKTSSSSASVVFEVLPASKRSLRSSEKRKK